MDINIGSLEWGLGCNPSNTHDYIKKKDRDS